jgi:hypothetical protein
LLKTVRFIFSTDRFQLVPDRFNLKTVRDKFASNDFQKKTVRDKFASNDFQKKTFRCFLFPDRSQKRSIRFASSTPRLTRPSLRFSPATSFSSLEKRLVSEELTGAPPSPLDLLNTQPPDLVPRAGVDLDADVRRRALRSRRLSARAGRG